MSNLHKIINDSDIKELLDTYANFHDACIVHIDYQSGSFVNENGAMCFGDETLKILFHSQAVKKTLELTFINVQKFNVTPLHDAMYGCTLKFENGFIVWSDTDNTPISENCTYVIAQNLLWNIL